MEMLKRWTRLGWGKEAGKDVKTYLGMVN